MQERKGEKLWQTCWSASSGCFDDADVRIGDDLSVDFGMASRKINDYDKNAIEAGRRIAEQTGGSVFGVSCGADETRKGVCRRFVTRF